MILFSMKNTSAVLVSSEMIADIRHGKIAGEEKETLAELGFLVESADNEKREMLDFVNDLNCLNRKINAIVVLDLDCNLACRYCFEGTRKGKLYLSQDTADSFVDFIKQRDLSNKDETRIVFYGGEPLLNVDRIVQISEGIRSFADDKGLKYSFSLITNGTLLTQRTVERLRPFGLRAASVTLDGPRDVHDAFRPFRSGAGSFETIVRNIEDVCGLISVQIGGNYTQDNYREFPRLLDYLLDNGLTPDKIPFIKFDPVVNESSEFAPPDFHDGCMSINEPWLVEASIFLREAILKRGYRTQKIMPSACMMQYADNLVMNYDGTLYKCPGLIGRRDFTIGTVKSGIADYRMTHCLDDWKNEECLACSYLPLCFGGCKYMKLVRDGKVQGVDCKKEYFDATLEAIVAQDMLYERADEK
jgi:uncharacterized protein